MIKIAVAIAPCEQHLKQYIVHFILRFQCDSLVVTILGILRPCSCSHNLLYLF